MTVQAVLDRTALLVGGTFIHAGAYGGVGALVAGGQTVKFARSLLVDEGNLGDDGLQHVSCWGGTVVDPSGGAGDMPMYRHTIRMQLLLAMTRSQLPVALGILTPFVEAYRDLFAAHVKLSDPAGANPIVATSRIDRVLDPITTNPLYLNRIGIEVVLEVTEKVPVSYSI